MSKNFHYYDGFIKYNIFLDLKPLYISIIYINIKLSLLNFNKSKEKIKIVIKTSKTLLTAYLNLLFTLYLKLKKNNNNLLNFNNV